MRSKSTVFPLNDAHKISGFFDSKDDINKFVDLYIEEKTKNFEDRYF